MNTWSNSTNIYYTTTATSSISFDPSFQVAADPAPRERTPFEWLDGEIERTCAVARGVS